MGNIHEEVFEKVVRDNKLYQSFGIVGREISYSDEIGYNDIFQYLAQHNKKNLIIKLIDEHNYDPFFHGITQFTSVIQFNCYWLLEYLDVTYYPKIKDYEDDGFPSMMDELLKKSNDIKIIIFAIRNNYLDGSKNAFQSLAKNIKLSLKDWKIIFNILCGFYYIPKAIYDLLKDKDILKLEYVYGKGKKLNTIKGMKIHKIKQENFKYLLSIQNNPINHQYLDNKYIVHELLTDNLNNDAKLKYFKIMIDMGFRIENISNDEAFNGLISLYNSSN